MMLCYTLTCVLPLVMSQKPISQVHCKQGIANKALQTSYSLSPCVLELDFARDSRVGVHNADDNAHPGYIPRSKGECNINT